MMRERQDDAPEDEEDVREKTKASDWHGDAKHRDRQLVELGLVHVAVFIHRHHRKVARRGMSFFIGS